jgi:hypothetical protein
MVSLSGLAPVIPLGAVIMAAGYVDRKVQTESDIVHRYISLAI